jgi:hypothetical protein
MAGNDSRRMGFRIANGPIIPTEHEEQMAAVSDLGELPRVHAGPILFAVARDPYTLFTYWNVDWEALFAQDQPVDRQVYLRIITADGIEESESSIEPMLGSYYARVAKPRGLYRVELGYFQKSGAWRSVAISEEVTMPADSPSESNDVDLATVPFHLNFQAMIELVCESAGDDPLTTVISHLQSRAVSEGEHSLLSNEEQEMLHAMNISLAEVAAAQRAYLDSGNSEAVRKRLEAMLGFGASSPAGGFGGSSRI